MKGRLIQRHDQFFKRLLDQPGTAAALLRERLPPEVPERMDEREPELLPGSFVPAELSEYRTDRLYRVRLKSTGTALVRVVVEHKSSPEPRLALQLLGYKTQILQWWDRREGRDAGGRLRPLPAVLSVVVYNGAAPWRVPPTLAGISDVAEAWRPYVPDFRYSLVDLGRTEDARLSRDTALRVGFLILKHGSGDGDLRATLVTLGRAALALGFDDLVALVRYMLVDPNDVEAGILKEVLAEIVPDQEERVMSRALEQFKAEWLAQSKGEWIAKGEAEGVVRGEAKGRAAALTRLLARRFGDLPPSLRTRIETAAIEDLDRWLDAAIDAPSLHSVFDRH